MANDQGNIGLRDAEAVPVPLRPMNLGDVLDGAFRLSLARWRPLLVAILVVIVPVQLVSLALQRQQFQQPGFFQLLSNPGLAEQFFGAGPGDGELVGLAVSGLLGIVAAWVLRAAVTLLLAEAEFGRRLEALDALRGSARRLPALVGVHLLQFLLVWAVFLPGTVAVAVAAAVGSIGLGILGAVALLAGLVAAVWLSARFYAALSALMVERLGPVQALRRSWRLTRPRAWWVVGVNLLTGILLALLGSLFSVIALIGVGIGGVAAAVLSFVSAVLSSILSVPIGAAVPTLVYFDGRVRQEGLDLAPGGDAEMGGAIGVPGEREPFGS